MPDSPLRLPSPGAPFRPEPERETGETGEATQPCTPRTSPATGQAVDDLETPSLGSVLDLGELGAFKLEACLGRGGMGEVYRARQTGAKGFSHLVAIKRLRPGRRPREERAFVDEARILSLLRHEGITRAYGFFEHRGSAYLVMEHVDGRTLYALLELARRKGRRFSEPAACAIAAEVASALHEAHRACDEAGRPLHIVHRDVSTTNILVTTAGRAKLLDFGVAYSRLEGRDQTSSRSVSIKGKVPYLSPEQVRHQPVDARSDLFSLGTILVEMLTGQAPFGWTADHGTLRRIAQVTPELVAAATPGVSRELRAICQKLLAREPARRFATGQEVAQALRRHAGRGEGPPRNQEEIAGLESSPEQAVAEAPALREIRRRRRGLTAAGLVTSAVIAFLAWAAHRAPEPAPGPPETAAFAAAEQEVDCPAAPERRATGRFGKKVDLPTRFWVDFVSFGDGEKCTGKPVVWGPIVPGLTQLAPLDDGQREPCPFGNGPIVARMSWHDPRNDLFGPGPGPRQRERPLLYGRARVVPVDAPGGVERLEEVGYPERRRVAGARMTALFTSMELVDGTRVPICGDLHWHDGKPGIPILADTYYGRRAAAEWGDFSFVQLSTP
ncbi:MAG TPA: serine/threonine-protein kinase [Myxococcales bacterium]|nr:serine/threonine-protein kinase [Myxococcales bacterium]